MSRGRGRMHPLETVRRETVLFEARGAGGHGVHGGADVVDEAGERELFRPGAAADSWCAFVHGDRTAGAGERDGGAQAVGTGADDYGTIIGRHRVCLA